MLAKHALSQLSYRPLVRSKTIRLCNVESVMCNEIVNYTLHLTHYTNIVTYQEQWWVRLDILQKQNGGRDLTKNFVLQNFWWAQVESNH